MFSYRYCIANFVGCITVSICKHRRSIYVYRWGCSFNYFNLLRDHQPLIFISYFSAVSFTTLANFISVLFHYLLQDHSLIRWTSQIKTGAMDDLHFENWPCVSILSQRLWLYKLLILGRPFYLACDNIVSLAVLSRGLFRSLIEVLATKLSLGRCMLTPW